ncbi:hypothetical protein [Nitrosomonas sp. Nm51]|uniref:hypothetical protein n=1 Tax=Nitrosomonas sp. Nm51 TaxID=133720 RepID=UPI0015A61DE0|nr:hypothetical protein [Nitrosomonas sp. Nm51]
MRQLAPPGGETQRIWTHRQADAPSIDAESDFPGILRKLPDRLNDHLKEPDRQVEELKLQIKLWRQANEASQKLEAISGIGPTRRIQAF